MARTFLLLPSPWGSTTVPRTIWSACLGSTPRRSAISTVSSNLANFTFCIRGTASSIVCGRSGTAARAAANFFPAFGMCYLCGSSDRVYRSPTSAFLNARGAPPPLALARRPACGGLHSVASLGSQALSDDVDTHRAGRARHRLHRRFERVAVEIRQLGLGDLLDLLPGHGADLVLVRLRRSLGEVRRPLQQDR